MTKNRKFQDLGIGVGLRHHHYSEIFADKPAVDFFEIISENFMIDGGLPLYNLGRILEQYTVVQHGVSLSIASADPLNFDYLKKLKELTKITKTPWFSDHLCWSSVDGKFLHDLLPVPYTQEIADYIAEKARIVQDYMELPFGIENLSTYVSFKNSEMTEWEFYKYIVEKADCYMMLDVNNIFVSSVNHEFDPKEYLKNLPYERVLQMHVAGHTVKEDGTLLDTHNNYVRKEVWELYRYVHEKTGGVATLLEWDSDFLTFAETHSEALKALDYREAK
jgi:uncharacterized protein (UPF0276 family)